MDARIWHRQATDPARALPPPMPGAVYKALTTDRQAAYHRQLAAGLRRWVLAAPLTDDAAARMTDIVDRNRDTPPGAKDILTVSAPFAAGKSTFVKTWAQAAYRGQLNGPVAAGALPTWQPMAGVTADWTPQLYVTLRAGSKIKDLNAALLGFVGYPTEGSPG